MPETLQNQNDAASQLQSGTFTDVTDNLSGLNKLIANKILNNDFKVNVNKILSSQPASMAGDAIKNLIESTAQTAAKAIVLKLVIIPIILVCIFAVPVIIVTLTAGGNIVIPIIVTLVLIILIRLIAGIVSKMIARKVCGTIFMIIEDKISQIK